MSPLGQMARLCRLHVPDVLFNPHEGLRGIEYGEPSSLGRDVVQHPFPHNPDRLDQVKQFSNVIGTYARVVQ